MIQARAKHQLRQLDVKPKKERGQNFVIDSSVIDAIIQFGHPLPDEDIIEIGPGLGALTEALRSSRSLTLIEIEPKFCKELAVRFPDARIINQDVRTVDISSLGTDLTIFGNLPYVFSTDIIFKLIESAPSVKRAVLLLQREFSERVAAKPGGRDYGVLTVMAQLHCEVHLGPIIPGASFHPPTKVESRVLELRFIPEPRLPLDEVPWFRRVVKAAFLMRRKKIHNSLKASGIFQQGTVDTVLASLAIDPGRRAETFTFDELAILARALKKVELQKKA